jgi:AraC family transcriptional regulator
MFAATNQDMTELAPDATLEMVADQIREENTGTDSLSPTTSLKDRTMALLLGIIRKVSATTSDQVVLEYLKKAAAARMARTQGQVIDPDQGAQGSACFSPQQLQQIGDYVQDNLSGDINLESIARQVGLGRAQFARRFKATTGMTPHKFVINARVRSAMAMLAAGELSLAEIAARTGFANPPHFAALFQRMTKVSPSDYRKQTVAGKAQAQTEQAQGETRDLSQDLCAPAESIVLPGTAEFRLEQTSLPVSDKIRLLKSSQGLGWTDLFAAVTDELPHEGLRGAVPAVWVVTADSNNGVQRSGPSGSHSAVLPKRAVSITSAGDAVYDELAFPLKARHLYLRQGFIDGVAEEMFKNGHGQRHIGSAFGLDDAILYQLIASIRRLMDEPSTGNRLEADYLTHALATYLLTRHSVAGPAPRALPVQALNSRQASALGDYIKQNLSANMGIDELAGVVGLGRSQFIRRFKATALMTPHQYVTQRRIGHARKLLTKSRIDYARIALDCGFADQSHFTTVFKRILGATPHEYRQSVR